MKRAKKLVTLVTVTSLTLGSISTVFGSASLPVSSAAPSGKTELQTTASNANGAVDTVKTETTDAVETKPAENYPDLEVKSKSFVGNGGKVIGELPVVTGIDDLNKAMDSVVSKAWSEIGDNANFQDAFKISYNVEDLGRYAKITLNMIFEQSTKSSDSVTEHAMFYVDKQLNKEISLEEYESGMKSVTDKPKSDAVEVDEATLKSDSNNPVIEKVDVKPAPAAKAEIVMLPLRENVEKTGLIVKWDDATKTVSILKDKNLITSLKADKNSYLFKGKNEQLSSAPINKNGTMFVPTDFFTKILDIKLDEKGNLILVKSAENIKADSSQL